jgi:hypothetical protein
MAIMVGNPFLDLVEFYVKFGIYFKCFSKPNKRPHDRDMDLNRLLTAQNAGEHGYPLFGKGVRECPSASMSSY